MEEYCDKKGIKHEFSAAYTPEKNGLVESKNKTLITLARAMLDEYGTHERFWAEAINIACYTSNRVYLHRLLKKTPYELLVGWKPNVSYFQVFGCTHYIIKKRRKLEKFESRTNEGILIGYSGTSKAYRVYNSATGCVEESYDVQFDESNGSQKGYEFHQVKIGDEPMREALRNIPIGKVLPHEANDDDIDEPSTPPPQPTSSS